MRPRDAVRRAVGYHLRALPPTLAGLGIAGAGVWYGAGAGTSATALAASGRLAPTVGLLLVGTAVTAVGRTAVRIDATAAAVCDAAGDSGGLDEDDLRETVAIATDRAVAASFDGAAAEIEARVVDAVDRAGSETGPAPDARTGSDRGDSAARADAPDAFAPSRPSETNALADATRRASERVESYLADGDAGEFRGLAEGAVVLDDEVGGASDGVDGGAPAASEETAPEGAATADAAAEASATEASAAAETAERSERPGDAGEAARSDGAEILDGDRSAAGPPDGTAGDDDAVIIDGDDAAADGNEMVFGGDVRDPESDAT